MRQFLTAKWSDLIMVNYQVDEDLLASRLPAGTELDLYRGQCFVSLVGFMFLDTRVKGFLVPGHVNFEEVNLRFYVKCETETETRRGVVFMKEIVPRSTIAFIARVFYGEPYEQWKMSNLRSDNSVRYEWSRDECWNSISVSRGVNLGVPLGGSHSEFIIEHYWGYTRRDSSRTDEYKVEHPKWELYHAADPQIKVDFKGTYGKEFAHLSLMKPHSVLLAAGSNVSVFKGKKISC
jgi:uncharacterized protein